VSALVDRDETDWSVNWMTATTRHL